MRRRGIGRVGRPSLIGTAARTAVIAGTASAVVGRSAAGQAQAAQAAQAQAAQPAPAQPAPAQPAAGGVTDELVAQIKQLADLRDSGILTEEEFSAKKAILLGI